MKLLGYMRTVTSGQDLHPQLKVLAAAGVQPQDVSADVLTIAEKASDRPGMRCLLESAEPGDTVIVARIDRLGRSLSEVLDTVTLLSERGINLRSVQDGIDTRTKHGRVMVDLLASLAEYDRHLTGERIAAGMASSRKTGTRLGRPPLDPSEIRDKIRAVEDARARGVTAADAAQLVGWSRATFYRHQQEHGSQR